MTTDPCARTQLYYDGELTAEEEVAAIEHLAGCEKCQAAVGDWMQLDAAVSLHERIAHAPAAPAPIPIDRARRRRLALVGVAGTVLAAAAGWYIFVQRKPVAPDEPVIALAASRSFEGRVSYAPLDPYRPLEMVRGQARGEAIPMKTLAALEAAGDRAGLAAALLLSGDPARAEQILGELPRSPERDSDLAAVAIARRDPERAVELTDRALHERPGLAQAAWNRALALRDLGLPMAAAAQLDRSAAADPRWAREARERAATLRAPEVARRDAWQALRTALLAMVTDDGPPPSADAIRRAPGTARAFYLHALRSARDRERVLALRPMAEELDRLAGTGHAVKLLERVAAADFRVRGPLGDSYRQLFAGKLDAAGIERLTAAARAGGRGTSDLLLGVMFVSPQPDFAAMARLADELDEPTLVIPVSQLEGAAAVRAGDFARAERIFLTGLERCDERWSLRCAWLEQHAAQLYTALLRSSEARVHGERARAYFDRAGEWADADAALHVLIEAERLRGRHAMARAYLEERAARQPGTCEQQRALAENTAQVALASGRLDQARTALGPIAGCDLPPTRLGLWTRFDLARIGRDPRDRAEAQRGHAGFARDAKDPVDRAIARVIGAALRLPVELEAGRAALVESLAAIPGDADGDLAVVRNYAYLNLLASAGERGEDDLAVRWFEEAAGAKLRPTCAAAVMREDDRTLAVVRGQDGKLASAFRRGLDLARLDAAAVITPALREKLAGCDTVGVLALPPLHGQPDLLPPEMAWSFATKEAVAGTGAKRVVLVTDAVPPGELGLPRLLAQPKPRPGDVVLSGRDATPARVLAELRDASYAEVHSHGLADLGVSDASFLALSPGADAKFALTAADLRGVKLGRAPVIVLAACRGAEVAPYYQRRWSLPDAFLGAGARAVFAAATDIPDEEAARFFDALRSRLERGEAPARALRDERQAWLGRGAAWVGSVMLFE